jgi:hypothetical protein
MSTFRAVEGQCEPNYTVVARYTAYNSILIETSVI